eukprot:3022604-Karenia_brevis.AAC.1
MANDTMVEPQAVICDNALPHTQGIIANTCTHDDGQQSSHLFRLLFTDSGHYLLPTSGHMNIDCVKEKSSMVKDFKKHMSFVMKCLAAPAPPSI